MKMKKIKERKKKFGSSFSYFSIQFFIIIMSTANAIKKEERELCWKSRDLYYECEMKAVSQQQNPKQICKTERSEYKDKCPKSWVTYFDVQREQKLKRDEIIYYKGNNEPKTERERYIAARIARKEKKQQQQ